MNQAERVLLLAIQKTIWNADITVPADTDWNAVLSEADKQRVLQIALKAAPQEFQTQWKSRSETFKANFIRILHYQQELCALLEKQSIPVVILKGTSAAVYYPEPVLRSMGDIDYLVPMDRFDEAKTLLSENGYDIDEDPRYYRHIHINKDGIQFEQHKVFSSEGIDVERHVAEGMLHIEKSQLYGIPFPMLPPLANGMILLAHLAQHLKTGLGLRQVIDWMLFVKNELNDKFWDHSFCKAASETGLDILAKTATRMCQIYLGLSEEILWCADADPKLCDRLMEDILDAGNFGIKRGAGSKIENVITGIRGKGLFKRLQFSGENNWKAYHKHPWLKPFAWSYQICRYTKLGLQSRRMGQILNDLSQGNQRAEFLKALKISYKD